MTDQWAISRNFTLTDAGMDLILRGRDTDFTTKVNNRIVLRGRCACRTDRVSLTGTARVGNNTDSAAFHSAIAAGAAKQETHPFPRPIPNPDFAPRCQRCVTHI